LILNTPANATFSYFLTDYGVYNGTNTFYDDFSDSIKPPSSPVSGANYNVIGAFGSNRERDGHLELNGQDTSSLGDWLIVGAGVDFPKIFFSPGSTGYVSGTFEIHNGLSPNSFFGIQLGLGDSIDAYSLVYTDSEGKVYALWGSPLKDSFNYDLVSGLGRVNITSSVGPESLITMRLELDSQDRVTVLFDYNSDSVFDLVINDFATIDLHPRIVSNSNTKYPSSAFIAGEAQEAVVEIDLLSYLNPFGVWIYDFYEGGLSPESTWVTRVLGTTTKNHIPVILKQEYSEYGQLNDQQFISTNFSGKICTEIGWHNSGEGDWFWNKPMPLLLERFVPGNSYTFKGFKRDFGDMDLTLRMYREQVSVPAGTFDCIKVVSTLEIVPSSQVARSHISTAWYAQNIGMVKRLQNDGTLWELRRYDNYTP
jgi:hypothetical protein